jgi:hypothetical protein
MNQKFVVPFTIFYDKYFKRLFRHILFISDYWFITAIY